MHAIDLDIGQREFFVLLGPSGSGKTTILRSIAGLEHPDAGVIRIGNDTVFSAAERVFVPPERRSIAMVFQSYAVWPHMNVYENVAFPLREGARRLPADEVGTRVNEVLDLLALTDVAARPVTTLSGGQQQRVALARALALRPKLILMDEPLSNLDFKLQIRLRTEIKDLLRHLNLTAVYVTHNQDEAMEIGDRVAVMNRGKIIQAGSPREIYRYPTDEFVARFIGEMGFLPATVAGRSNGFLVLDTAAGHMRARPAHNGDMTPGSACFFGVRPEDFRLLTADEDAETNVIEGNIIQSRFVGEAMIYSVAVGSAVLGVRTHHSVELAVGERVRLLASPEYCVTVSSTDSSAASFAGADAVARV